MSSGYKALKSVKYILESSNQLMYSKTRKPKKELHPVMEIYRDSMTLETF